MADPDAPTAPWHAKSQEMSRRDRSGNPGGRPRAVVNVQELARTYTEQAVHALAEALGDPKLKVQAAVAILDRGWGRPVQALTADPASSPTMLHLLAAQAASQQLMAAPEQRTTINGHVEPEAKLSAGDLLSRPSPLE
jgi:hypothetical protein